MSDDRAPDQVRTMIFPWIPGARQADEPEHEHEAPARGYPRQLRRYDPLEPPTLDTPGEP